MRLSTAITNPLRHPAEIRATTRSISFASSGPARFPAWSTSSWVIGASENPAATFDTSAKASTSMPPCARDDCFGHGRHSHDVRSQRPQHLDLGGGLVAGPGHAGVDPRGEIQPDQLAFLERDGPQPLRVDFTHVREADPEPLVVRASQRIVTKQIQMVGEDQETTRAQAKADSPGGRRQDQHLHSELLDHPNRKCDGLEVVTLVVVEPPLEDDHVLSCKFAAEDLPGVPGNPGDREMRNSSVRDDPGVLDAAGELVQSRAEHDRDGRRVLQGRSKHGRGLLRARVHVEWGDRSRGWSVHKRIPAMQAER